MIRFIAKTIMAAILVSAIGVGGICYYHTVTLGNLKDSVSGLTGKVEGTIGAGIKALDKVTDKIEHKTEKVDSGTAEKEQVKIGEQALSNHPQDPDNCSVCASKNQQPGEGLVSRPQIDPLARLSRITQGDSNPPGVSSVQFEDVVISSRNQLDGMPLAPEIGDKNGELQALALNGDVCESYDKNVQKLDTIHRLLETMK